SATEYRCCPPASSWRSPAATPCSGEGCRSGPSGPSASPPWCRICRSARVLGSRARTRTSTAEGSSLVLPAPGGFIPPGRVRRRLEVVGVEDAELLLFRPGYAQHQRDVKARALEIRHADAVDAGLQFDVGFFLLDGVLPV